VSSTLCAAFAVLALSSACSSSNSKTATPTRPPGAVSSTVADPAVSGDSVDVPSKGYSAKVPADFHLRSDFATDANARFPTDAFFGPKNGTEAQASIAVTCYALAGAKTLSDYRDERRQFIESFSSREIAVADATVSGLPAFVFTYKQTLRGQTDDPTPVPHDFEIEKQDYVLVQEDCRWVITLLTAVDQFDTYKPAMASFIAALKFRTRLT
jgi:hypothetical protein